MPRPTRIDFPGALFHVLARGNQRRRIFRDRADYSKYESLLQRYQQRYAFHLYAYVLMPNHIHLLLETGRVALAKIMQGLQQSYTAYFNRKYRLVGHCFQGRYRAILCDRDAYPGLFVKSLRTSERPPHPVPLPRWGEGIKDCAPLPRWERARVRVSQGFVNNPGYLLTLVRYLHLNPVRAELVQGPGRWRWSSHAAYLQSPPPSWVAVDRVLAQFARNRAHGRAAYLRFMADGVSEGHRDDLYHAIAQQYLGDKAFVEAIERKARVQPDRARLHLAPDDCIRATCSVMEVRPEALQTADRSGNLPTARALVAYMGRELAGIPFSQTARVLRRSPVTFSLQVQRLQRRLDTEPALAGIARRIEERLRSKRIKA